MFLDFQARPLLVTAKLDYLFYQSFADLWSNERLLNLVEQLIGPEIMGHPVWNLRTKTPQNEATTVPWHQGISVRRKLLLTDGRRES